MNNISARIKTFDLAQQRSAGNIVKFLVILLVFTIIARGTSGATLARVTLASPDRSEIIESISGSAIVTAAETLEITVPEWLIISDMLVAVGQKIEAGDPIAIFEMEDLQERRIREAADLSQKNLDLEKLERDNYADASSRDIAARDLNRAHEDYSTTIQRSQTEIDEARIALELLLESAYEEGNILPSAILAHQRALEDYYATRLQGEADIAAAEEALRDVTVDDTALQTAILSHQRALDDYKSTKEQGEADITAAKEALEELQNRRPADHDRAALETAQRNHRRARDDYNALRRQTEGSINVAQSALDWAIAMYNEALATATDPMDVAAAWAEVERAQSALNAAQGGSDALLAASRRVEDEAARLAQAQRDFDNAVESGLEQAENALQATQTQAEANLLAASRRLEDAVRGLEQAQRNFDNSIQTEIELAENALVTAKERAANDLLAAARRLEDASVSINSEIERAQSTLQTAINRAENDRRAAARQVENARASLNAAEQNHRRNVQQAADTIAQNMINASTLRLDIAAQQYTVDTLDSLISNGGILYARYGGAVSMAMLSGQVTNSEPLITLRDTDGNFEAQMQISQSEAARLAIGSEVEVTTGGGTMFFTPTTTGTISAISQPDEDENITITIRLPYGNWGIGQRIDAQVILSRANYDFSVPVTALNSDNMGYFVLVVEQRSTVLGLQNVVVRVNVTIVAADDMMVSVRGAVGRGCQVIVGSNRTISVGDRIRVSE